MIASHYPKYTHLQRPGKVPLHGGRYDVERCKKELEAWAARAATVDEAADHLTAWRESLQFVRLFEKYFPQEYAVTARQPNAWLLDSRSRIAPIEQQFFALAESRLFPFGVDWMEMTLQEIRHGEDYLSVIPLCAVIPRPDEWDTSSEQYPVIQVLHCFSWNNYFAPSETDWCDVTAQFAERGVLLPKPMWYPWHDSEFESSLASRLHRSLMQMHMSVFLEMARANGCSWLGTTLQALYHETNNALVDFDEEMMYEPLEWTEDNLDWLIEEWKAGSRMLDTFWGSINLMQKQPEVCARLIELWNASWACATRQLRSPRGS